MAKVKTYRALRHLGLMLHVTRKDGNRVPIEFTGGTRSPKVVRGTFQTGDKELQAILEKHPRYNEDFKLIREEEEEENEKSDGNSKFLKKKEIKGIKTVQDAKNYLMDNYDEVKAEDVKNKDKILEVADKVGITFPELQNSQ